MQQVVKNTSKVVKKVDLADFKCNIDKLDVDKLENVQTNISTLKSKDIRC